MTDYEKFIKMLNEFGIPYNIFEKEDYTYVVITEGSKKVSGHGGFKVHFKFYTEMEDDNFSEMEIYE